MAGGERFEPARPAEATDVESSGFEVLAENSEPVDFDILSNLPTFDEMRAAQENRETAEATRRFSPNAVLLLVDKLREKLSDGQTRTTQLYLRGGDSLTVSEMRTQKGESSAYIPERQDWHAEVLGKAMEDGRELSERLGPPPRIIAMRGGCGSGKTTSIRRRYAETGIFDENGDVPGAVKPDYFKTVIIDKAEKDTGLRISAEQAHLESTGICKMYTDRLIREPNTSMLIDKQLDGADDITKLIQAGKETNKPVEILDNDVPIELSAFRVLKRELGGADPNMPYDAVVRGYLGIRANRAKVVEDCHDEIVSDYTLRAFDPKSKDQVEVIKKVNGELVFMPGREELAREICGQGRESAMQEAAGVGKQEITEGYIKSFTERFGNPQDEVWTMKVRNALSPYLGLGMTLKEALDSKSDGVLERDALLAWKSKRVEDKENSLAENISSSQETRAVA